MSRKFFIFVVHFGLAVCALGCAAEVDHTLDDVPAAPRGMRPIQTSTPHVFPIELLSILRHADTVERISLDPELLEKPPPDSFHRFKMLGSTKLADQPTRDQLIAALRIAVEKKETSPGKCFWPHHGMRAIHDGQTVDLSICFTCSQIAIYVDGKHWGDLWVDDKPLELFDQALRDAGVPLWKPRKKSNSS